MDDGMFLCEECGEYTVVFDCKEHQYHCTSCGSTIDVEPTKDYCWACGAPYKRYTWFFPSGCQECGTSFVE